MEIKSIDADTPKDRPILLLVYNSNAEDWPLGVEGAVGIWYATHMRQYIEANRRPGDEHVYDYRQWEYWAFPSPPQGSIDTFIGFEPTHWCDLPGVL